MRYAIVVEKAANELLSLCARLGNQVKHLLLAIVLRKLSAKFVKQSNFISKG